MQTAHVLVAGAVAEVAERHPELVVVRYVVVGDARQMFTELSATASTIVLGSRGRGVFASMVLGSVSASVSMHASCPVVVTRPAHRGGVRDGVVVGADGTAGSQPVIELAFRQASFLDLPLTVMHCHWNASDGIRVEQQVRAGEADAEGMRALLAESVAGFGEKFPDVPVSLELNRGLVDECLTGGTRGWNLIVVSHHPTSSAARYLSGSAATARPGAGHDDRDGGPRSRMTPRGPRPWGPQRSPWGVRRWPPRLDLAPACMSVDSAWSDGAPAWRLPGATSRVAAQRSSNVRVAA